MLFIVPILAAVAEAAGVVSSAVAATMGPVGAAVAAGATGVGTAVGSAATTAAMAIGAGTATAGAVGSIAAGSTVTAINVGLSGAATELAKKVAK